MLHPDRKQDAISLDGGPKKPLPAHMKDYMDVGPNVDQGGVHLNVGIPNKAAALIGEKLGRDTMAKIYVDAMRSHMGPRCDIAMTAQATKDAATSLFGADSKELSVVTKAWAAVGVS
jgi:aureolysin